MATAPKKKTETSEEIIIPALARGLLALRVIGETPMFQHRMAAKAMRDLLCGSKQKTKADRAEIKHDPFEEFRQAAEIVPHGPTALGLRVVALKAAMCTAALETAGINKTTAQRLLFMPGDHAPLYGTPQLRMDIVRNSDINRTPDIRTRPFLPRWGAEVRIEFVRPQMSATNVIALACNAGVLVGLGDFRQEKGRGAYGSFRVLGPDQHDDEWDDLVENHGRPAQEAALRNPVCANEETAELMAFWTQEARRRGHTQIEVAA